MKKKTNKEKKNKNKTENKNPSANRAQRINLNKHFQEACHSCKTKWKYAREKLLSLNKTETVSWRYSLSKFCKNVCKSHGKTSVLQ